MNENLKKLQSEFKNLANRKDELTTATDVQKLFDKHISNTSPIFQALSNEKTSPILVELRNEQRATQRQIQDYTDTLTEKIALDAARSIIDNYVKDKDGIITVLENL